MSAESVGVAEFAVLGNRLQALVEAVNDMRAELREKPSTAQVASMIEHLTPKRDHDQHTWQIAQLQKDMERLARETDDKILNNSPKRLWGNLTLIATGLVSILSLLIALGVIKRTP